MGDDAMNVKSSAVLAIGLVVGIAGGAAGLYFAYWAGLVSSPPSAPERGGKDARRHMDEDADHEPGERGHNEGPIRLPPEVLAEFGIKIAVAAGGDLRQTVTVPGEILLNPDKLAHIVPRVGGIVRDVQKTLGDSVQEGNVLAVLESRELAEAKAAYLASKQRLTLAQANLAANEELKTKGIVSDLDFLAAKRDLAGAEIELRAAEYKLHTFGIAEDELVGIEQQQDTQFSYHEIRAPFTGTLVGKHITLGEVVSTETTVFELADLSEVWVNLTVYQKDLGRIRSGQEVTITARDGVGEATGTITYVSPVVEEATRTADARVVLPNPEGRWRPGLFVTGRVELASITVPIRVPKTALQSLGERTCVFVETDEGLQPRPVVIGRADDDHAEVVTGLHAGERYVAEGAFALKAELAKESFGEGHTH
jgi:cobalt-zinc-cadmium efflux system membrane fusion protein